MPTANIYSSDTTFQESLMALAASLQQLLASELTCPGRTLLPNEISVRIVPVSTDSVMIAPVEIEITAHAYGERVSRADKICLVVRQFVKDHIPLAKDVRVWLILAELGHSWEE